jgi:hypothetical protein
VVNLVVQSERSGIYFSIGAASSSSLYPPLHPAGFSPFLRRDQRHHLCSLARLFVSNNMLETKTKKTKQGAASHSVASSPSKTTCSTITSALAAEPDLAPSKAASRLFPNPPAWKRAILRHKIKEELEDGRGKKWNWHKGAVHDTNVEPAEDELQNVREKYGYKSESEGGPSRLYTMVSLHFLPRKAGPEILPTLSCSLDFGGCITTPTP